MSFMDRLRTSLAEALVLDEEEGSLDESGNLVLRSESVTNSGISDDDVSTIDEDSHRPEEYSDPTNNLSRLKFDVYKDRYKRAQKELEQVRTDASVRITQLQNQLRDLQLKTTAEHGTRVAKNPNNNVNNHTHIPSSTTKDDCGSETSSADMKSFDDVIDELEIARQAKASLQATVEQQQLNYAALCDRFDRVQEEKHQLEKKWSTLQATTEVWVGQMRKRYPIVESKKEDEQPSKVKAATLKVESDNKGTHNLIEDLLHLKQSINDAIIKIVPMENNCKVSESTTTEEETEKLSQESNAINTNSSMKSPTPDSMRSDMLPPAPQELDLKTAKTQDFVQRLQQLVLYICARLVNNNGGESTLKLQLEQVQRRLSSAVSDKKEVEENLAKLGEKFSQQIVAAENTANDLRKQREDSEQKQDQLLENLSKLSNEKKSIIGENNRLHTKLDSMDKKVQEFTSQIEQLKLDLEKKNITWDEYALYQAQLEESEDLCKQQAEKLAVQKSELDEASATIERLQQEQTVNIDRLEVVRSDLAIRDEDLRQVNEQLENLTGAMQRLDIESDAQKQGFQRELQARETQIENLEQKHATDLAEVREQARQDSASELKLRDDKVEHLTSELQAAQFATDAALRKLREATSNTNVDRRLVATMLGSYFRARGSGKKQAEIIALIAKILEDPALMDLGRPQSMAGKAGSLLGSLWGSGGSQGRGGSEKSSPSSSASFGDLWMEFLIKEAGSGSDSAISSDNKTTNAKTDERPEPMDKDISVPAVTPNP